MKELKVTNSRCKCSGCGEFFNSTGAFDKHRKGKADARYCDTSGMVKNDGGYWVTALNPLFQGEDND